METNQKNLQQQVDKENTEILGYDKAESKSVHAQLSAVSGHFDKQIKAMNDKIAATETNFQN